MIILNALILICLTPASSPPAATHLVVIHAGPCDDDIDLAVKLEEFTVVLQNYDSVFSGVMNVTQDIDDGWVVKATMQKCADIRNIDTCDFLKTLYLVKEGCTTEEEEYLELYTMFFHYTQPELECPLRAGSYRIVNYPVFTEDNHITVTEAKISNSIFGYTFTLEAYTHDERKIMCVEAHLQLLYMREHNWMEKKNNIRNLTTEE